jgi:hypothetical protein
LASWLNAVLLRRGLFDYDTVQYSTSKIHVQQQWHLSIVMFTTITIDSTEPWKHEISV